MANKNIPAGFGRDISARKTPFCSKWAKGWQPSHSVRSFHPKSWINSPLRSFGSNHVDFGGIVLPPSATRISSAMEVG